MRIARLGVGSVVPLAEVSAASLEMALQDVLSQPSYREAAASAAR
jgi:zeaxanthin glucosyltransferase